MNCTLSPWPVCSGQRSTASRLDWIYCYLAKGNKYMQFKGEDGCHYQQMDFVPIMRGNHMEQIDTASNNFILVLYILTGQFTYKKAKQEAAESSCSPGDNFRKKHIEKVFFLITLNVMIK